MRRSARADLHRRRPQLAQVLLRRSLLVVHRRSAHEHVPPCRDAGADVVRLHPAVDDRRRDRGVRAGVRDACEPDLGQRVDQLDESLRLFEEGVGLSRRAGELLNQAERKVEALTRAANGTLRAVPFDVESGE